MRAARGRALVEVDFFVGCVLLFLFLKVLPEVDFLLIVYAMSFSLLSFFMLFRWWRRCSCNRARSSSGEILNKKK